ncbi:MAG: response regulator [Gallionellaceae bacterium]|jgi:CheY-like chemotaxis protein
MVITDAPLVLVVDDHPINRTLLARQIRLLGLSATIAENARVGMELWRDGRFAMIITDCHMPDMEGYEMTRAIRKIEAIEGRPRTPVIAWTANALKEDQIRIKAAGMDELLAKPVNLHVLRALLSGWLRPNENDSKVTEVKMSSTGVKQTVHTSSPINYSVLDASLTNKDEQTQLLQDFLVHIRGDRIKLDEFLTQDDHAAMQSAAHRMKGSCLMVGAVHLGNACTTIVEATRTADIITMRLDVAELDKALHDLEKYVGQLTSPI